MTTAFESTPYQITLKWASNQGRPSVNSSHSYSNLNSREADKSTSEPDVTIEITVLIKYPRTVTPVKSRAMNSVINIC